MLFDRATVPALKSRVNKYPAPRRGWIKNENLALSRPDGAEILDNIFPTAQGARLRGGRTKQATIAGAVVSMFRHKSGSSEKLFAASSSDIYNITAPSDPDVSPAADVTGLSSGDWSTVPFANSAGEYLVLANGIDSVREYDGSTWTTPSITGVASSRLSQVWSFKERLFFIEKDTLSAWYLAVNAISGAATELPLKGIFHLGGSLLFGATWSLDSGSGLDDVCIFVTTEGEVAVYAGTDPGSASTWALQGVYRIGVPLSKNGWFKSGGDLAVLTEDGIIPISQAINHDRAALQASAITYPIEDAWLEAVANRTSAYPFNVTLWHSQALLLVGVPGVSANEDVAFVANAKTGAWCRFTGWDVQAAAIFGDILYFGQEDGTVWRAEDSGTDQTSEYAGIWLPKYSEGGFGEKFATHARFRGRASEAYNVGIAAFSNYDTDITLPTVTPASSGTTSLWGTAIWGTDTWAGGGLKSAVTKWSSVSAQGQSVAPAVRIPSHRATKPDIELIGLDLVYQEGGIL